MQTRGAGSTHVGRARTTNEDAFLVDDGVGLYAVADGVGGHAGGERAAALALGAAAEVVRVERGSVPPGDLDHQFLRRAARGALASACEIVHAAAARDPELAGMACTLTLLIAEGDKAAMAHVGDSRLYLCRGPDAWLLSTDHTVAAELVRRGEITREREREHPYASALTRAVGIQPTTIAETLILDLLPDDVFVLASDGLTHYLEGPAELAALVEASEPSELPDRLVELANERGGRDNVTAVVVRVDASEEERRAVDPLEREAIVALDALAGCEPFRDLRFADRLRVLDASTIVPFAEGEALVRAGADPGGLWIPLGGAFEVEGGRRPVPPGTALFVEGLFAPVRSRATVVATQATRALHVERAMFQELVARRPRLGLRCWSSFGEALARELDAAGGVEPPADRDGGR